MSAKLINHVEAVLDEIREQGLYKQERPLVSPQGASIHAAGWDADLINLCANNYLGLANHPRLLEAANTTLATAECRASRTGHTNGATATSSPGKLAR